MKSCETLEQRLWKQTVKLNGAGTQLRGSGLGWGRRLWVSHRKRIKTARPANYFSTKVKKKSAQSSHSSIWLP